MADKIGNRFRLKIDGVDLEPHTIPLDELGRLLALYGRSVRVGSKASPDDVAVSLVGVTSGSGLFSFAISEALTSVVEEHAKAIAGSDFVRLSPQEHDLLAQVSDRIAKRGWTLSWVEESGVQIPEGAIVSSERPVPKREQIADLSGETVLYGQLRRIGGRQPRADLVLDDGTRVSCPIKMQSPQQVRELAARLYTEVGLRGEAQWDSGSSELIAFSITEMLQYRPGNVSAAFRSLAGLSPLWGTIDLDEFEEQVR